MDTELTMACSEQDSLEDDSSSQHQMHEGFCPQEYMDHISGIDVYDDDDEIDMPVLTDAHDQLCVDEIVAQATSLMKYHDEHSVDDECFEDCDDGFSPTKRAAHQSIDEIVARASTLMTTSEPECGDYGFISRETLDKVLSNPVQLAASLTIMAHFSNRDAKLLKSRHCCRSDDEMPTIEC